MVGNINCEAITIDTKQKKSILKLYLGFFPAWFDLRKKEILSDNIDIKQWQFNMNFLIYKHGTINPSEKKALNDWTETFYNTGSDEMKYEGLYLEEHATPILLNISDVDLPPILCSNRNRNWFLAAYPDVVEYFYPTFNLLAMDFDAEQRRVKDCVEAVAKECERMQKYLTTGKGNQAIYLTRMKHFYKNELRKNFLLCR